MIKRKGAGKVSGKKTVGSKANAFSSLKVEDLDEELLKSKVDSLENELDDLRTRCLNFKKENEWYRDEIETIEMDTADYIKYLESKKSEKDGTIQRLLATSRNDLDIFMSKKNTKEQEHSLKIKDLKTTIAELEVKMESRSQEIISLSDILSKRARHEVELAKIRKEMQDMEFEHQNKLSEIERALLEDRMKMQKEADARIHSMESEAHQKAAKYLEVHTSDLKDENASLERELRQCIQATQEQLHKKENLERQNRELLREQKLREDIIKIRLDQIRQADVERKRKQKEKRKKLYEERVKQLQSAVAGKAQRENLQGVINTIQGQLAITDVDWSDEEDLEIEDYLESKIIA